MPDEDVGGLIRGERIGWEWLRSAPGTYDVTAYIDILQCSTGPPAVHDAEVAQ